MKPYVRGTQTHTSDRLTRMLLVCGIIGPSLFIIVALIEGATRPSYSAWRLFVSALATGPGGWMQITNFIICGLLSLAFVAGLRRTVRHGKGAVGGPVALGIFSLALISAGIFVTDPGRGYPPGAASHGPQSLHGIIHALSGVAVFFSLAIACFLLARRFAGDRAWSRWAWYSIITGVTVIACFVASLFVAAAEENGTWPNSPAGLLQRIAIVAGFGWLASFALTLLRAMSAQAAPTI